MSNQLPASQAGTGLPTNMPCAHLVHGNRCPHNPCEYDHSKDRVDRWRANMGPHNECIWKENCQNRIKGCCLWWHPPETHDAPYDTTVNRQPDRSSYNSAIMEGVKWLRAINTTDRPQRPVIITITDKDEVTSFNIISNNQIAIPGKYMSLISPC